MDAVYKVINLVQIPNQLIEFSVQSVTEGIDALGTVTIRLKHQESIFSGQASDTDIVVAAAYAYMNALNRLYRYLQSFTHSVSFEASSPMREDFSYQPGTLVLGWD